MDGTTLCPHCDTRFRIAGEQLEAHQGMVRCGHCMQAFDARPGFVPDQADRQLELPILDQVMPSAEPPQPQEEEVSVQPEATAMPAAGEPAGAPETPNGEDAGSPDAPTMPEAPAGPHTTHDETPHEDASHDDALDFSRPLADGETPPVKPLIIQPTAPVGPGIPDEEESGQPVKPRRSWPWAIASTLLLLLAFAQLAYFFRVELAVRLPGIKPMLVSYCGLLDCTVPLPQNADLMSIESSELEADPEHVNQITLVALLRNRAAHPQAFPNLELSLNDTQDKVLARRVFKPADYLPAIENEAAGLRANRELSIRLRLDTSDLRPTGYRLALFYP